MTARLRSAFALTALLIAVPASAQGVKVYLFDRLEQPTYAHAWTAMFRAKHDIPYWIQNKAKGAIQGTGNMATIEGKDVELYSACQPHNCDTGRFAVMFIEHGKRAKSVLIVDNGTPQFFGAPDAIEAAALIAVAQ